MKTLPLEKLRLDGETQPRTEIDQSVVNEYARLYEAGVKLEPVDAFFDGTIHWLADGFHRWHAARKAGLDKIKCNVHQGTQEDAQWFSVAANKAHGLQRSNADKVKAVKTALKHPKGTKMSDGQLAEYVGVSDRMIAKYRAELTPKVSESNTREGRDGRTIDTTNIGGKPELEVVYEKCPKCGGEEFFDDGTCESCVQDADPGEETDVKPTDPGDPATILKCDIRDVVQLWHESVADANLMVAACVLEGFAEELRESQ